jgi:hypothetical protein
VKKQCGLGAILARVLVDKVRAYRTLPYGVNKDFPAYHERFNHDDAHLHAAVGLDRVHITSSAGSSNDVHNDFSASQA